MAFTKILVLFVGMILLGTPASMGHPRPRRSSERHGLRHELRRVSDAVRELETRVHIQYNDMKDRECDNNDCHFLSGLDNPLCNWPQLAPHNHTMTVTQIKAELMTSQLSLKLWNCTIEPLLKNLGPDYTGDENGTGNDNIPRAVRQVQDTIRSLNIDMPDHVKSTPCSVILLHTFKRQLTSFRDDLRAMRAGMHAHAQ
ncbi:uncharacterized protein LOC144911176 [Branchiostoma floridae x Branchiostoma belcheri]